MCMLNLTSHKMTFDLDCWCAVAGSHMVCASESCTSQGPLCFLSRSLWQFSEHLFPFFTLTRFPQFQGYCVTKSCSNTGTLRWLTVWRLLSRRPVSKPGLEKKTRCLDFLQLSVIELHKARKELKRMSWVTSQPFSYVLKIPPFINLFTVWTFLMPHHGHIQEG